MIKVKIHQFLFLALFLTSCEDVITLDLNNGVSTLVVDGYISNQQPPYRISLSKSSNYFEPSKFTPEQNALVIISDDSGAKDTLREKMAGVYETVNIKGTSGRTYTLNIVTADNKSYSAASFLPSAVPIDSLHSEVRSRNNGPGGPGDQIPRIQTYQVSCYFNDPESADNYYRLKYYKNDTLQNGLGDYVIASDQLANGQSNSPRISNGQSNFLNVRGRYVLNDLVKVEVLSIDKKGFEFYSALQKLINDQGSIIGTDAPSNPVNNISNGALGYFGAYAITVKSMTIK